MRPSTKISFAILLTMTLMSILGPQARAWNPFGASKPLEAVGAVLSKVEGDVSLIKKGETMQTAAPNSVLATGDQVKTGRNSLATLAVTDGSVIQLAANTTFTYEDQSAKKISLYVAVGMLKAWIKKKDRSYSVRTPTSVAAVRGTEFTTLVDAGGGTTWDLHGGSLQISDNFGNNQTVRPGTRTVSTKTEGVLKPQPLPPTVKMEPKPTVEVPDAKEIAPAPVEEEKKEEEPKEELTEEPAPKEEPKTGEDSKNLELAPPDAVSPSSP